MSANQALFVESKFPSASDLFLIVNNNLVPIPWKQWASEVIEEGYAIITISPSMMADFKAMQEEIKSVSISDRKTFSFVDRTDGFYPVGYSYLDSVVNSDLCETFNYWSKYKPEHKQWDFSRSEFYAHAERYESHAEKYGQGILDAIRDYYGYETKLPIKNDSYLQFNHYREDLRLQGGKYLQKKHEDGHLLTIIKPNGPGLVVYKNDQECLVELGRDQAIVIPGSLLTRLTEGEVDPMYHAVINFTLPAPRCSIVYNINIFSDCLPGMRTGSEVEIFEAANIQHMQFGHNPLSIPT